MKVTGSNIFSSINQLQVLTELNLKEGQKVIGRIISLSTDEAILDIAGRQVQAKVEGNPPPAGTPQTFLVKTDEQGRIVLKVLANPQDNPSEAAAMAGNNHGITKAPVSGGDILQKNIITSLLKDGLKPTPENVAKVTQFIQEFQTKYRHSLQPKVFTFIMSQKWPVTPATVLASWVYQDQEIRDLLWNKLPDSLQEKEAAVIFQKLTTGMNTDTSQIQGKLKSLTGFKLQDLLEKLNDFIQQSKTDSQPGSEQSELSTRMNLLKELVKQLPNETKVFSDSKTQPEQKTGDAGKLQPESKPAESRQTLALIDKNINISQTAKQSPAFAPPKDFSLENEKAPAGDNNIEANHEKVKSILEQNLALTKAILKETAANGSGNLIPLLVNDSQSMIRECLVHWKEERGSRHDDSVNQAVYLTIPTENLGDINLALRIGINGARLDFRVNSEEIRKYLLAHSAELKERLSKDNLIISVNLKENEDLNPAAFGVDLWM